MMMLRASRNRTRGYAIAESPAFLYVLFLGLTFPLVNLCTVGLRYSFLVIAAHESATQAALSRTFQQETSPTDPSAKTAAEQTAQLMTRSFDGVHLKNVTTRIEVTHIDTKAVVRTEDRLALPADTTNFMYMLETELAAQVNPLIAMDMKGIDIPGLTGPMQVSVCSRKLSENPQGLNQ